MRTVGILVVMLGAAACGGAPFTNADGVVESQLVADDAAVATLVVHGDGGLPHPLKEDAAPEADVRGVQIAVHDAGVDIDAPEGTVEASVEAAADVVLAQPPPACGPATCAGCCGLGAWYGMCFEGTSPTACGTGGGACAGEDPIGMGSVGPPCWACTNGVCEPRPDGG